MSITQNPHAAAYLRQWDKLENIMSSGKHIIEIDGESVDVSTLVASARYGIDVRLSTASIPAIEESAEFIKRSLAEGLSIYGVNTGFGGSADVRTNKTENLQDNLIDFLNCGITTIGSTGLSHTDSTSSIPEAWVKASILIRANSLARGHSGMRLELIDGLINLLNHDIVPLIPLRGSISASGDLIPLSYIAGALQGKRGIKVFANKRPETSINVQDDSRWGGGQMTPPTPTSPTWHDGMITDIVSERDLTNAKMSYSGSYLGGINHSDQQRERQIIPSCDALADHGLPCLKLAPKEGLSLVNGTAVSAAAGALAMHDAQGIAILAQILTAMSVEALNGTCESFHPFFGDVRPHPGQIEAAKNMLDFLHGSKLVRTGDEDISEDPHALRQDRYSLRTSPQWIGPQLENLTLAQQQVEVECNSTTDNPLLDVENNKVLHGGNFQAVHITSAMEKTRQSLQQFGRMLFVQSSELVNPAMNNGLPPNLEAGEPSEGFLMKGVDISTAALCSELGFLANPMTPHIQTAEMGNQSLNSMAFVSARYTHTALDVISQLAAAHLFVVCQALDLRCIQNIFFELAKARIEVKTLKLFNDSTNDGSLWSFDTTNDGALSSFDSTNRCDFPNKSALSELYKELWSKFQVEFNRTATQDSTERFHNILNSSLYIITSASELQNEAVSFGSLNQWAKTLGEDLSLLYKDTIQNYIFQPSANRYLGSAAYHMWKFVRHELGVPFHGGIGGFRSPNYKYEDVCVGDMVSKIYASIKDGGLIGVAMNCLRDTQSDSSAMSR